MGLTLREALTLAEPLRRAKVLAGAKGLDRVVEAVNVMEVPDILEWVRPGELLVTTLYPLRDKAADLENLVPKLAEKGLVGLAITPESYIDRIPACMIEAAERLNFPLIELPPKVSFIDIIQPLTSRILNIQANELRQSEQLLRQFLDLILRGGSFADIAELIGQSVGQPVVLVDRFRRLLGASANAQTHCAPFLVRDSAGEVYLNEAFQPEEVGRASWGPARHLRVQGHPCVAYPIRASSMELGEILVWGELPSPLPSAQMVALEHGATVAALKMMELRAISQVEQQFQNEILEGLLSDQPGRVERARKLAVQMQVRLEPPFRVAVVAPDLPVREVLAFQERESRSSIDTSLHLARRYIRVLNPEAVFWRQGARLIVFFPVRGARTAPAELVRALREVCQRVAQENPAHSVSIGLSPLTADLFQFAKAYRAAMQSLELGRVLWPQAKGEVIAYEDLGFLRLFSLRDSLEGVAEFCQEVLGPLLREDKSGALLVTLRTYLEQGQNLRRTAQALGIHYNTARYRLRRLRALLGPALTSPTARLSVELALHLLPLLQAG
ncbi:MAG: PucR family transcriptional regulator ligand-binding domain-containing protein [Candidatus Bipolaricaulota bacterium]|nr:PucR family transcriptional regulator ligand-binding domain-containing protein [Candidatus Bipolaricaulota bacterium]